MSVSNKVSSRAPAIIVIVAIALLAVFAPAGSGGPIQASHGGMDTMAIDVNPAGNSAGAVGAIDQCGRINRNGTMDADEDFIDGLFVDVVGQNIPAVNTKGTPSPADDTGGILGYGYRFNYQAAQFTVSDQEYTTDTVNILASNPGSSIFNSPEPSEPLPDNNDNNRWESTVFDMADQATSAPESGSGVLDRLSITAEATAPAGQYLFNLTDNFHVDAGGTAFPPHSTGLANIAVGVGSLPTCGALIASYGYYHPVTPARILDTRTFPQGVPSGKVQAGDAGIITVDVTGIGGVPATGVSAVVVNATATQLTGAPGSFLTVYPSGDVKPNASNLNFVQNQDVPNLVTVGVGPDGNVKVFNAAGAAHVIFDVVGWYGGPTGGSQFKPLEPKRILSTRDGIGAPAGVKIGANQSIVVDVTDTFSSGVPASGVTAVVVNTTVTEADTNSFVTVYPADATLPNASNLNFVAGQTVPNLVTVKVGVGGANDGKVKVYNKVGNTHVIFDVVGFYGSAGTEVFTPLTPSRFLDTRTSPQGSPPGKVQAGDPGIITVDVTKGSVPSTATGVIINTTVTEPTINSFLTVYPSGVTRPDPASNLNFSGGQTVPNLVIVKTGGDGNVKAYNKLGQTHVIFDNVGYFAPVP
jgi:hypothetical protein